MSKHPIPTAALDDDCLAFLGMRGSGKTYNAGTAVERILARGDRAVIADPLGVWWGLRVLADGKTPSPYKMVIFGGPHGDLPLTENAGALIGETVATMKESAILDLTQLGTEAAERRFMLAFLTALYRHSQRELLHLILDEADMWAPQKLWDKTGEAARLVGMTQQIVRRGRVKGFVPWLITQRPAVLSWDVLSQVHGIVTFTMTAALDRKAIGNWVKGQADEKEWNEIWKNLPTLERGEGFVWIPRRHLLARAKFPQKITFDSSRTPERGEKTQTVELQPLDLTKLKDRLAKVEAEVAANDPAALKKEIARLQAEARKRPIVVANEPTQRREDAATIRALKGAVEIAMKLLIEISAEDFFKAGGEAVDKAEVEKAITGAMARVSTLVESSVKRREDEIVRLRREAGRIVTRLRAVLDEDMTVKVSVKHNEPFTVSAKSAPKVVAAPRSTTVRTSSNGSLPGPQQKIVDALAWWEAAGVPNPTTVQVAVVAKYSPTGGAFRNPLGALNSAGLICYPTSGNVALTDAGRPLANHPGEMPTTEALHARVMEILSGPERKIITPLLQAYPDAMATDDLAAASGYAPDGGAFRNPLGALRSLKLIDYPAPGQAVALPILFPT